MILNCTNKILSLKSPVIMAIVNVTPDSFYDGGKFTDKDWKEKIINVLSKNPDIVDLGGMSSRPGADIISADDEWNRIKEPLLFIKKEFPETLISIDTIHSTTAVKSLDLGAHIINDISAGLIDNSIMKAIAPYKPAYVMMHMKGNPKYMQNNANYSNIMLEILDYFKSRIAEASSFGIDNVILDPGIGFSKTIDQNYNVLNNTHLLKILSDNILIGLSRKSMIYKVLGLSPKESLNGTSVLHLKALQEGARILRVHDVDEARQTILLFEKLSVNK